MCKILRIAPATQETGIECDNNVASNVIFSIWSSSP